MASRIWRTRGFHLLRGMDGLAEDLLLQFFIQGLWHDKINLCDTQEIFQVMLYSKEMKQSNWTIKLDQQVDIAGLRRLAASG